MDHDLRDVSFEEFLDFLFDHPVAKEFQGHEAGISMNAGEEPRHRGIGFPGKSKPLHSPERTADHYIALFEDPEFLPRTRGSSEMHLAGAGVLHARPIQITANSHQFQTVCRMESSAISPIFASLPGRL